MKNKLLKNLSLSLISLILFFTIAEITPRLFWDPTIGIPHQGVILEGNYLFHLMKLKEELKIDNLEMDE